MKCLEDEADASRPIGVQINRRAEFFVFEKYLASGGRVESAQQLQQGGFAAAAGSADGNEISRCDGEIDAAQGFDASLVVALAQAARFQNRRSQHRLSHGGGPPL